MSGQLRFLNREHIFRFHFATFSKLQFKTKPGAVCDTFIVSVKPFKLLETRMYYNADF